MTWLTDARAWCSELERQWLSSRDQGPFWSFATKAFSRITWSHGFELQDVISEFVADTRPTRQLNPFATFGEPAVTLFSSEQGNFVLDLYIWESFHTGIHQHGFEGCFTVVQGQSIETSYSFERKTQIGPNSFSGILRNHSIRLINRDEVISISPNDSFIHRVLHLDRPTVSLVLRTAKNITTEPQLSYHFHSLASPSSLNSETNVRYRILEWMIKSGITPGMDFLESLLPYHQTWNILIKNASTASMAKKLFYIYFGEKNFSELRLETSLKILMNTLTDKKAIIIATAAEFFHREDWAPWVCENLGCTREEAIMIVKDSLPAGNGNLQSELRNLKLDV